MDMDAEAVRESPVGDPVQDPEGKGEEEQGEEGGPSSSPGPGSEVLHSPQNVDCEDLVADGDHGTHVAVGVEGPHPAAAAAVFDVYADHAHAAPTDVIADIVHEERDQGKEELAGERAVEEEEVALGGGGGLHLGGEERGFGVLEEEKAEEEQEDEVKDLVAKEEEHRLLPWEEGGGSLSSEERSVLELVAATGGVWHGWNRVRSLIRHHMIEVLDAYNDLRKSSAAASGAIGPPRPLPTGESYDELKERLVEELEKFEEGPPFTIQRLCELLLNPRQHSDLARISFALEKVLMVTSSMPKSSQPCPPLPVPPAVKKIIYWRPSTPAERAAAAAAAGTAGRAGTVDPASEVVEGREGGLGGEAEAMDEERAAVVPEVERGEENQQAQIAAAALANDALEGAAVVDRVTEADMVADEVRAIDHEDDGSAMEAGGGQEEAGWREEAGSALPNAAEPMQVDEERMVGRQEHRQQGDELMVDGVVEEDTAGSQQEVLGPQPEGEELHDALQLQELELEQREAEQHQQQQQQQQQVDGKHAQEDPLSNSAEAEAEAEAGAEAGVEAGAEADSSEYSVGEDVAPPVGQPEGSLLLPASAADSEALKQAKESSPERRARAEDELDHELRKSKLQRLVHEEGACKEPLCEKEKEELSDLELEGVKGETKGGADAGVNVGNSSESAQEGEM